LTNLSGPSTSISSTFGDLITTTNNGGGLSDTLEPIQDGFGNTSAIELSTDAFNIVGEFQVGGVQIIASGAQLNGITNPFFSTFPGGMIYKVTNVTAALYNVLDTNYIINVNRAGAVSIVLPDTDVIGNYFIIKDASGNAAANHITITVQAAGTIDGAVSYTINQNYGFMHVYSSPSGNEYFIVSSQGVVTP